MAHGPSKVCALRHLSQEASSCNKRGLPEDRQRGSLLICERGAEESTNGVGMEPGRRAVQRHHFSDADHGWGVVRGLQRRPLQMRDYFDCNDDMA